MILKAHLHNFRNAEHLQFMSNALSIFSDCDADPDILSDCYEEMGRCGMAEEEALAAEKDHEKIREKNEADDYRDRLHRRLFNYVKSITYDKKDPHIANALAVFKVLKDTGNPTHLSEDAESAMITTLGNRLEAIREDVEAIGAQGMVDALMDANREFIVLEKECRDIVSAHQLSGMPPVRTARRQTDAAYRIIVNTINGLAGIPSRKEMYRQVIAEMNTLITKFNALVASRGGSDGDEAANTPEEQPN